MAVLRLGVTDAGAVPLNAGEFFGPLHEPSMEKHKFRGEENDRWRGFAEKDGRAVFDLQTRLRKHGFLPFGDLNGSQKYR